MHAMCRPTTTTQIVPSRTWAQPAGARAVLSHDLREIHVFNHAHMANPWTQRRYLAAGVESSLRVREHIPLVRANYCEHPVANGNDMLQPSQAKDCATTTKTCAVSQRAEFAKSRRVVFALRHSSCIHSDDSASALAHLGGGVVAQ